MRKPLYTSRKQGSASNGAARPAKAAAVLLLLLTGLFLSACHGRKQLPAFEVPAGLTEGKKYEITFWAKNDTNVAQTRIYQKAIQDFQTLYPDITVNLRLYTDYGRIYNDVITNIPTQTTPNVCITYPDHIATYLQGNNVVAPLDQLIADSRYGLGGSALKYDGPEYDEVVPEFLKEGVLDGVQYAIPYMRSTEACYINKTLVEKLGYTLPEKLTWDFVWEVSDKAAEKNADGTYKVNGQKVMIPFIYKSTDNMMIQMLKQKKAGYSKADGTIEIFNDTTKELLFDLSEHVKKGSFSTFKISSYPGNFLNAGQCIFAIDSTAGATWMGTHAPNMDISRVNVADFTTVVTEIPQFDPEEPAMISQGPSICIFNKEDSGEVLASWLFAQYLLTNEVQMAYAE
ncbi:MAG: extracellular solute-binding protein, partial [Lachnospiraceae bacterium]|nr:extracellular solute-binding protein [Lachnospiraceae bacterium]